MYRTTRRSLAAVALAAAVTGATATSAAADTTAAAGLAIHPEKRTAAQITRHWTAARMRNARPVRLPAVKRTRAAVTRRDAPAGGAGATEG